MLEHLKLFEDYYGIPQEEIEDSKDLKDMVDNLKQKEEEYEYISEVAKDVFYEEFLPENIDKISKYTKQTHIKSFEEPDKLNIILKMFEDWFLENYPMDYDSEHSDIYKEIIKDFLENPTTSK